MTAEQADERGGVDREIQGGAGGGHQRDEQKAAPRDTVSHSSPAYTSITLDRVRVPIAITGVIVFATRVATLPQTFWQSEEVRFARALLTFDPLQQQPEPPGYPLYVGFGRLFNFFIREPFTALLVLSVVAAVIGACITALAAAELLGNAWAGAAGALLLYLSPAMLVFDPLPNAEATAMALIAAAFLALVRGNALWLAIFASAAIGVMPQIALAMLVMSCVAPAISPAMRRASAAGIGGATLILSFVPLIEAIGLSNLAPYAKTNYAALRTSSEAVGLHGRELLLRFIAHPWGSKWLSFPVLIAAAIGLVLVWRRPPSRALAAFAIAHLVFCFAFADRAAGVQPVIPAMIGVAIFAASALSRWPRIAFAAALIYGGGACLYASMLLLERHRFPSPPAAAMRYARRSIPSDAVLLYEPSLEAWARMSRFNVADIRDFDRYVDRQTPLFLLADGSSETRGARQFHWTDSDAYGKVTTERYRVVSLVPFPPATRYRSLGGVYGFERTADGPEWRWLTADALIELPPLGARVVHVRLGLPQDAPIESNAVTVNGTTVTVPRGRSIDFSFPAAPLVRIRAARSFTSQRDHRTLAVQLLGLEQR